MIGYLVRRILQMIPVVLAASILVWAMVYAVPGDPVSVVAGENATAEQLAATRERLGLDRPVAVQYLDWLGNAVRGDLGFSLHSRKPVMQLIGERLPATLQLAVAAMIVALAIGIPVALVSAARPGSWIDRVLDAWSALSLGVPTFWLGILLILLFAVELRWLPSASRYIPFWQDPVEAFRNTVMPALTLGIYVSGVLSRFLRAALVNQLRADYVRTAHAKGLRPRTVLLVHVLRNALLPFITVVGMMMALFIGGTVVTEAVFTYPGLGRLLIQAIASRDYPVIQGCIMVMLVAYIVINIVVDALYSYVDPRIELA